MASGTFQSQHAWSGASCGMNVGRWGRPPSKVVAVRAARSRIHKCDTTSADAGGMWPFYTRDSPGLKVGLLPKLVQSSVRCFCILHFWGKRSFMDLASSICLSSEEERRKKNPTSLGSKA
ncbi:unnamed protein product [Nyctereutes procyonoides]|uniref:(raccoon dog) hypothetical protein n=1 Tax=Nyctereutes procyonoides TaxID=34880 RepID=A0A811Z7Y7_NYCPR|nr:unnamed protein product [Nyctereutes procyonoides]